RTGHLGVDAVAAGDGRDEPRQLPLVAVRGHQVVQPADPGRRETRHRNEPTTVPPIASGATSHRSAMSATNAWNAGTSASESRCSPSCSITTWTKLTPSSSRNAL